MRMRSGDTVVHMIPAAGYYAAYQEGDELTYNPVAAWVVLEDQQGRQRVDGIDPSGKNWDGSSCSDQKGFIEFVYRDERERRR
jgi:hypothetical protein